MAHGISEVHVWTYSTLRDQLPKAPWLFAHSPRALDGSLFRQVWWQFWSLAGEARRCGCQVLLSTDAGTVGDFHPAVVISGDMLSYEPGASKRYGFSKARLRLIALRYIQNASLRHAEGAIFLTNYAADVIQRATGPLRRTTIVPHGVGTEFRQDTTGGDWPTEAKHPIRCLYVSNAAMYKHQWVVVRAIGELRRRGHDVLLILAGGGFGKAQRLVDDEIARTDPNGELVELSGPVRHAEIPRLLANADLFVFASSCETMPNTLVEAMTSGLPIACSSRGPMPEVLRDGGVYFDPEDWGSIADAVEQLIVDRALRMRCAKRAQELSENYSWVRCASETWGFVAKTLGEVGCESTPGDFLGAKTLHGRPDSPGEK